MSTAEALKQQAAERVVEISPMLAFPRMIEVVHHNKARKAYRDRVNDAHRAGTAAMRGETIPEPIESEPDDMGDSFSIQGDTVQHYYSPQPSEAAQPLAQKPISTLVKAALAAALLSVGGGAGVGIPWMLGMFNPQTSGIETPADTSTQVIVE